jgi:hypothetical protein
MTRWQQVGSVLCGSIGVTLIAVAVVLLSATPAWAQSQPGCQGEACDRDCTLSTAGGSCVGRCDYISGMACATCQCKNIAMEPEFDCACRQ